MTSSTSEENTKNETNDDKNKISSIEERLSRIENEKIYSRISLIIAFCTVFLAFFTLNNSALTLENSNLALRNSNLALEDIKSTFSDYLIKGNEQFDLGDFNGAIRNYEKALEKEDNIIEVSYAQKWKAFSQLNTGIANKSLQINRNTSVDSAGRLLNYTIIVNDCQLSSKSEFSNAYASLRDAIDVDPTQAELYLYSGIVCLYLNNLNCNCTSDFKTAVLLSNPEQNRAYEDIQKYALIGQQLSNKLKDERGCCLLSEFLDKIE